MAIQESVRCSSIRGIRPGNVFEGMNEGSVADKVKDPFEGEEGLKKFAMSIYIVKEMC